MAKDFDSSVNSRVKEIRKELKLTQAQFSHQLETQQSYYSEIERGNREVNSRIIQSLIVIFNISSDWLLTGKGEQFKGDTNPISKKDQEAWDLIKEKFQPDDPEQKYLKPALDFEDIISFREAMDSKGELKEVLAHGDQLAQMSQRFHMFVRSLYSEIMNELLFDYKLTYKRRSGNQKFFEQNKDKIRILTDYSKLIEVALIDFKNMLVEIKPYDKSNKLRTWFDPKVLIKDKKEE